MIEPAADLDLVIPLVEEGDGPPLFCVHAVSGSAYTYLGLAQSLTPPRPVFGIEAPGFDTDREPVESIPELSAEYVRILRAFHPNGEINLLGWSMGGALIFEMAKRLAAEGIAVAHLILVDSDVRFVADPPPERELAHQFLQDLLATAGGARTGLDELVAAQPATLSSAELLAVVAGSPEFDLGLDAEILQDRFALFRPHVRALYRHETTGPYAGPVVQLSATDSPPEYQHWERVASNVVKHLLPGDHHSIWTGASLALMAGYVSAALAS